MAASDEYISDYRILSLLFKNSNAVVYQVELQDMAPAILISWKRVVLTEIEDVRAFEEVIQRLARQHGFEPLAQGVDKNTPYLVVSSIEESQLEERKLFLEKIEQELQLNLATLDLERVNTTIIAASFLATLKQSGEGTALSNKEDVSTSVASAEPEDLPTSRMSDTPPAELMGGYPVIEDVVSQVHEGEQTPVSSRSTKPLVPLVTPVPSQALELEPVTDAQSFSLSSYPPLPSAYHVAPNTPAPIPYQGYSGSPLTHGAPLPDPKRKRRARIMAISAVILILLLISGGGFFFLPTSTAHIEIAPKFEHVKDTYSVEVVSSTSSRDENGMQIAQRTLSISTSTLSITRTATGKGIKGGARATGQVVFSEIEWVSSSREIGGYQIRGSSGVAIYVNDFTPQGTSATVSARSVDIGNSGNIPAYDINGYYRIYEFFSGQTIAYATISNPVSFSGGLDGQEYTYVTGDDYKKAFGELESQLAVAGKEALQKQMRPKDQMVGEPECSYSQNGGQDEYDEVVDFKIDAVARCTAAVFDMQEVIDAAVTQQEQEVYERAGKGYTLLKGSKIGEPEVVTAQSEYDVSVDGWWIYSFDANKVAQQYASRPQILALRDLEDHVGIKEYTLTTSGFGGALPSSASNIKVVLKLPSIPKN